MVATNYLTKKHIKDGNVQNYQVLFTNIMYVYKSNVRLLFLILPQLILEAFLWLRADFKPIVISFCFALELINSLRFHCVDNFYPPCLRSRDCSSMRGITRLQVSVPQKFGTQFFFDLESSNCKAKLQMLKAYGKIDMRKIMRCVTIA